MKLSRQKITALLLAVLVIPSVVGATSASAETFTWSSAPLTNLDPAGTKIFGGFSTFPTGSGLYLQQCIAPVAGARPATCSDTIQLWITETGEARTTSPKGSISLTLKGSITGRGTVVDCTTTSCGLFFRLDHNQEKDTSQDKFIPITFKASSSTPAPALAADEVVVTLNGVALTRNVPLNLAYQAPVKIVATAKSGLPVTLTSLTPECSIVNGVWTALKGAGQCALGHSTDGNATFDPSVANYPFILIPGTQKIDGLPKSLKVNATKTLPGETTFGSKISYKSKSSTCVLTDNFLVTTGSGKCVVKATAPAKAGMWKKLALTQNIKITK